MEIKLNTNKIDLNRPAPIRQKPAGTEPATDGAAFHQTEAINQALSSSPDIRPEKVTLGQKLVGDAYYPPPEIINKLSNLLALYMR